MASGRLPPPGWPIVPVLGWASAPDAAPKTGQRAVPNWTGHTGSGRDASWYPTSRTGATLPVRRGIDATQRSGVHHGRGCMATGAE